VAGSSDYRAVVLSTGGRVAPLAGWAGARAARSPLILWASLWAHPRTPAHALTYLPLARLYRSADAVVTYGEHVSAYVRARGARNVYVARQSVDNDFWRAAGDERAGPWTPEASTRFLFVGREAPEKGIEVLLAAWRASDLARAGASLALVGGKRAGSRAGEASTPGVIHAGRAIAPELRRMYAAADVVVVPSIATRTFREPWGLVVNEAMNCRATVIASDAVGAAAGGLVRDGVTGMVVRAGDSADLAHAMRVLAEDAELRERYAQAGAQAVLEYSHDAWARGFSEALAAVGRSRGR
jgi:glycosyltransferase involved in cell wall biosynthesis